MLSPRLVADTTGNRRADVIELEDSGVYISFNNGNNFQDPRMVIQDFASATGGWQVEKHNL